MHQENPTQSVVSLAITGGLAVGGKLRENRMLDFTPLGLNFRGEMSREQFVDLFAMLRRVKCLYHVMLADAVQESIARYGTEFTSQTLEQIEFEIPDVVRANTIALAPTSGRKVGLSSEHYFVIGRARAAGKIATEAAALNWMEVADREKLSPQELDDSIEAGKIVRSDPGATKRNSGIATIEGVVFLAEQWKRKVDPDVIRKWEPERKRKLLVELQALDWIAELRRELEAELIPTNG